MRKELKKYQTEIPINRVGEISFDYRGYKIRYNTTEETWECEIKGEKWPHRERNLKTLKHAIDRTFRKEFKPMDVFVHPESGSVWGVNRYRYVRGTIVSIAVDERFYIRVPGREKTLVHNGYDLLADTLKNAKAVVELEKLEKEIDRLEKRRDTVRRNLKTIDRDKIFKEVLGKEE